MNKSCLRRQIAGSFVLSAMVSGAFAISPGYCDEPTSTQTQESSQSGSAQAGTSTDGSSSNSSTVLKGGVKGAALLTVDGLQKMGESIQDIRRTSFGLMSEVTRKDTVVVRGPNVINGNVIIPALPNPSGTIQMGNLPARKKEMEYFMARLSGLIQLLQNEIDALIIPDDKKPLVDEKWSQIRQGMEGVQTSLAELKALTTDEKHYDNIKIGKRALYIYEKTDSINKLRRDVLKKIKAS